MQKMSVINKITISAMFVALGIILSRLVSLPGLFGLPFLKIGFTPSLVMFSSFYLGPVYGLIVGSLIDIIGAILVEQGGSFNILYTIAAALTGLMPYLIYVLLRKIKIEEKFPFIGVTVCAVFSIGITIFMLLNDSIKSESGAKSYTLYPWMKWSIIIACFVLSILFIVFTLLLKYKLRNRHFAKTYNINLIASSVFLTYFLFKIPVGSAVQAFLMNWEFSFIFGARALTGFFTSFVHILIICVALDVSLHFHLESAIFYSERVPLKERLRLKRNEKEA